MIAAIIISNLVKSRRKIGSELERCKALAKEPQRGLYEELDYVQMHTDCSKAINIKDNVSYSTKEIMDKEAAHSELSLKMDAPKPI